METIVAIDLGKRKNVVCTMDRGSLKTQYRTVRTQPEVFHDLFAELDVPNSMVLFEVGNQAGWVADMQSLEHERLILDRNPRIRTRRNRLTAVSRSESAESTDARIEHLV